MPMPVFHMIYRGLNYANLFGGIGMATTAALRAAVSGAITARRTTDALHTALFGSDNVDDCSTYNQQYNHCDNQIYHTNAPF